MTRFLKKWHQDEQQMQEDEDAGIFREIRARDTNTKALEAMPLPTGKKTNKIQIAMSIYQYTK